MIGDRCYIASVQITMIDPEDVGLGERLGKAGVQLPGGRPVLPKDFSTMTLPLAARPIGGWALDDSWNTEGGIAGKTLGDWSSRAAVSGPTRLRERP